MAKERILSGMRASGRLHLGNYLGALQHWVQLQREYECYYFIADWHALTTGYADTAEVQEAIREIAIDYLSAGLHPDQSVLFIQSRVPEHAELHLLLSMMTPVAWLERIPTYKEQQQEMKDRDLSTYGFLGYSVWGMSRLRLSLMSAVCGWAPTVAANRSVRTGQTKSRVRCMAPLGTGGQGGGQRIGAL